MKQGRALVLAAVVFSLLLSGVLLGGCDFRQDSEAGTDDVKSGLRAGREVLRYSFDQETLDPALWSSEGGAAWKVVDGELHGAEVRNKALWFKKPLPESVRVEFDARSESPDGDLKVEIFGDGTHHESGYVLIFGGWKNSTNTIARLDEHGTDRKLGPARKVKKGKVYRMAIVRTGSVVRWFIDGEPFMSYEDERPLKGEKHQYFAFNNWSVPVYFDNLVIYDLAQ